MIKSNKFNISQSDISKLVLIKDKVKRQVYMACVVKDLNDYFLIRKSDSRKVVNFYKTSGALYYAQFYLKKQVPVFEVEFSRARWKLGSNSLKELILDDESSYLGDCGYDVVYIDVARRRMINAMSSFEFARMFLKFTSQQTSLTLKLMVEWLDKLSKGKESDFLTNLNWIYSLTDEDMAKELAGLLYTYEFEPHQKELFIRSFVTYLKDTVSRPVVQIPVKEIMYDELEFLECTCGLSGVHYPCDEAGAFVDPDENWEGYYTCTNCHRLYQIVVK